MALVTQLREILEAGPARTAVRRKRGFAVWDLAAPGLLSRGRAPRSATVDRIRRELLETLAAASQAVFMTTAWSPVDEGVPGTWTLVAPGTWVLAPDFDPVETNTAYWLELGNWTAYVAAGPVEANWPDPFRAAPEVLIDWMRERHVAVVVSSFPDGSPWVVALSECAAD
jgi:hypothetical protein